MKRLENPERPYPPMCPNKFLSRCSWRSKENHPEAKENRRKSFRKKPKTNLRETESSGNRKQRNQIKPQEENRRTGQQKQRTKGKTKDLKKKKMPKKNIRKNQSKTPQNPPKNHQKNTKKHKKNTKKPPKNHPNVSFLGSKSFLAGAFSDFSSGGVTGRRVDGGF